MSQPSLNFPACKLRFKEQNEKQYVFDIIRKKFVAAGPEEIVRQNLVHFLINHLSYPKALISIEKEIQYNELKKRTDLVVYNKNGHPQLIAECKAPYIKINQDTFNQISRYNLVLKVPFLVITNGNTHYSCKIINPQNISFLEKIPHFSELQIN